MPSRSAQRSAKKRKPTPWTLPEITNFLATFIADQSVSPPLYFQAPAVALRMVPGSGLGREDPGNPLATRPPCEGGIRSCRASGLALPGSAAFRAALPRGKAGAFRTSASAIAPQPPQNKPNILLDSINSN